MHYKRLIMTVTAPQVCSMLDLLFSSQALLSLPLTTCMGTLTHTQQHTHTRTRAEVHTHTHAPTRVRIAHSCCVSGTLEPERRGYYMNQPHTTVVFTVL